MYENFIFMFGMINSNTAEKYKSLKEFQKKIIIILELKINKLNIKRFKTLQF